GDETFSDIFLHEQARTSAAHLALVEPDGIDNALYDAVQIGIIEDDERGFAAQLEREFLTGTGGGAANAASDIGRAGEGDLVDIWMAHQRLTNLRSFSRQDIDDTRRQAHFLDNLREFEGGQRGVAGGFQYNRIAHCHRVRNFPGQHEQWEVPGDDLHHDADRNIAGQFLLHPLHLACV